MKTQTFTYWTLFLLLLSSPILNAQLQAQCNISNPTEANETLFQINWETQWNHISIYGDWGEDYFSFYAETGKTYLFSTMPAFGGNTVHISNDDTQFSVWDQNNQPAPGLFGNAFHDDFAPQYYDYKPTFAWSPSQTGTYRLLVTKYEGFPGCQELGSGQSVTVAFRRIPQTSNFAIWTGSQNVDWFADICWLSRGSSGQPGMGLNADLSQAYVLLDSDLGSSLGAIHTHRPPSDSMSITISKMVIGPRQTLEILPQTALVITSKLEMPMYWAPFSFLPQVGAIHSVNPAFPGTLHIKGPNAHMNIPNSGNLQNLRLVIESNQQISLDGVGSAFEGESVFTEIELKGVEPFTITGKVRVKHKIHFHTNQLISVANADPYSYLKLEENTQIIGAGEHRFISTGSRPVIKIWSSSQPFELPIGDRIVNTDYYAPIKIDPTNSTQVEWSCIYDHHNPYYHAGPQYGGIDHISRYDNWKIETDLANIQAKIAFQWNAASYVSHQLNDLTVAAYDLNYAWQNVGGNQVTGGIQVGQITTNILTPNQYSDFSLASTTANHGFRLSQQPTAEFTFACYPNPANSQTQLKLSQPLATNLSLRLVDVKGRKVQGIEIPAGQIEVPLQLSHLSAGIYYLIANGSSGPEPLKLMKE